MTYLMLFTALVLSGVAAYYSIFGLTALFAAAFIPIVVMGCTLEVAKLVVASWLYRRWNEVNVLMKSYFVVALLVLMFLTSMGIFGFLSKAHLDQALPSGEIAAQIQMVDQKIEVQKQVIADNRTTLNQLDEAVNQIIKRSTNEQGAARSVAIRNSQVKERAKVNLAIENAQKEINKLLEQKAPIASQLRQLEAEVGPVKYIASLIYGDTADQSTLENAVRIVILLIVFVFDPLAVLMLIAFNSDLKRRTKNDRNEEGTKNRSKEEPNWSNQREESTFDRNSVTKESDDSSSTQETVGKTRRVWQSDGDSTSSNGKERRRLQSQDLAVAKNQESISVDWEHDRKLEPVKGL